MTAIRVARIMNAVTKNHIFGMLMCRSDGITVTTLQKPVTKARSTVLENRQIQNAVKRPNLEWSDESGHVTPWFQ